MTTLDVERLHVRWTTDARTAEALDHDVLPLLERSLEIALLDDRMLDHGLLAAAHVCIPAMDVAVRLDPGRPAASNAEVWATRLLEELHERVGMVRPVGRGLDVHAGGGLDEAAAVVVYPRHVDAVADAVVGLQAGDLGRQWAWAQAGVLDPSGWVVPGHADAVVERLVAVAELIPAVLHAVLRAGRPPRFGGSSWARLARAWAVVTPALSDAVVPQVAHAEMAGHPLSLAVPEEVWHQPHADAVARLLLGCLAPADSTSEVVASELAATMRGSAVPDRVGRVGGGAPEGDRPADGHGEAAAVLAPADFAGSVPEVETDAAAPIESPHAGLMLAVRAVDWIGLHDQIAHPDHPLHVLGLPSVLVRVAALLLGERVVGPAPTTVDPVVRAFAGLDPSGSATTSRPAPPPDEVGGDAGDLLNAAVTDLTGSLEGEVRIRLGLDEDESLAWLWRRPGRLAWSPGWVEVTFDLESVDLRVRRAGLDLDPGWVWWLGAVVRYRYA